MRYRRFEDLPVWQTAVEFALLVFKFTNIADLTGLGDTKNQLERASLSVSSNIADGFERGITAELIRSLYMARGAVGESRSILCVCERVPRFSNFKSEISNLKGTGESISRQLHGWIEALKNIEINGNKVLSKKDRERLERYHEFDEFDAEMEESRRQHLRMRIERDEEAARRRFELEMVDDE